MSWRSPPVVGQETGVRALRSGRPALAEQPFPGVGPSPVRICRDGPAEAADQPAGASCSSGRRVKLKKGRGQAAGAVADAADQHAAAPHHQLRPGSALDRAAGRAADRRWATPGCGPVAQGRWNSRSCTVASPSRRELQHLAVADTLGGYRGDFIQFHPIRMPGNTVNMSR